LFGGIAAEARAGDFVLYNSRVRFVIQAPREGHGYVATSGGIIDVDLVRPEGAVGRDTVDDIFTALGLGRLVDAETVEVIHDGSDGGTALVRAVGRDVNWTFIQGAVEAAEPIIEDLGLEIITDYELEPDSWTLKMTTTFHNAGFTESRFNVLDGFMAADEVLLAWAANEGIDSGADEFDAVGAVGTGIEATLSIWRMEGPLRSLGIDALASSAGLNLVSHGWETLPVGETRTVVRYWSVAPDPITAEVERWTLQGVTLGTVTGTVTDAHDGSPVAGARVHFVAADDRVAGYVLAGEDGSWTAQVPLGDYSVVVEAQGRREVVDVPLGAARMSPFAAPSVAREVLDALASGVAAERATPRGRAVPSGVPVTVSATEQALDLTLPAASALRITIVDDAGAQLPAVIEIFRADGEPHPIADDVMPIASRLGLDTDARRAARVWTGDGDVEVALPPGTYVFDVHHSWRHGRKLGVEAVLIAGTTTEVVVELPEIVPRDGRLSMDSHLHAAPSNDASIPMEDRLIQCAALGVDLPVTTDHDRISDYRPIATALDLDGRMTVIPGVEVSPVLRGHVNVFPAPLLDLPNGGAEPWWETPETTDALYARIRSRAGEDAVIQANHPRNGLFDFGNWNADLMAPMRPDFWTWEFEAFELVNGKRLSSLDAVREDWFSFLDLGRIRTPMGVSDSHGLGSPCGYGRTDLLVGVDSPVGVDQAIVRDAVRAGTSIVAVGLTASVTLTMQGGDRILPGATTEGTEGEFAIEVRSPDWIVPDTLRIWRNGVIVEERDIEGPAVDGVWLDERVAVEADTDSWFVVEILGDTPMGSYFGGALPYAAANAFFVDVDGNGWVGPKE
jgi:hypothetical protein